MRLGSRAASDAAVRNLDCGLDEALIDLSRNRLLADIRIARRRGDSLDADVAVEVAEIGVNVRLRRMGRGLGRCLGTGLNLGARLGARRGFIRKLVFRSW